jgi:ArsR family transcriptional regulator
MKNELREEINRLHAEVCSALADPNRILLLYKLSEHPMNVSELSNEVELPQPTVSRQLKVLRDRGMVSPQRDGQAVFYSLTDRRIIKALDLLRAILADSLETQIALARTANETFGKAD